MPGLDGGDRLAAMSKAAAALIGIASAAGLFATGCSTQGHCGGKCPTAIFDLRALGDSTVTWSVAGAPSQTTTGITTGNGNYPPSGTDCWYQYTKGRILRPLTDGGAEKILNGYVTLACAGGGYGLFEFIFWDLADYRTWTAGTSQIRPAAGEFSASYPSSGGGCTSADLDDMPLTITVETATGRAAAYPTLVTDDFERTFRVDFDTTGVTPASPRGACDPVISVQASLHLMQAVNDFVYNPNGFCMCE